MVPLGLLHYCSKQANKLHLGRGGGELCNYQRHSYTDNTHAPVQKVQHFNDITIIFSEALIVCPYFHVRSVIEFDFLVLESIINV